MPIRSAAVGLSTDPLEFDVTPRKLLAYAAGIGDTNPQYFDDAAAAGIVAHPAFIVSVEWPAAVALRLHDDFRVPRAERLRAVHAGQDSTFHRPIRPGDRLRTSATLVQVRAIAPGALVVTRLATVDAVSHQPVVTSYSSTIYRGVAVQGNGAQIDAAPALPVPLKHSMAEQQVQLSIAREAPHIYTECAAIWNPIHTERRIALEAGLPDIILHGTATYALAASQLINRCAGGNPLRLHRLAARFAAMIIPGTTITVRYTPEAGGKPAVPYTVCNADNAPAITHGLAIFTPPVQDQDLLTE